MPGDPSKYSYQFDVWELVDALGGVYPTYEALKDIGCTLERKSVQKWKERGTLSNDAVASIVMAYRNKFKVDIDITDYIKKRG